MAAAAKLSNLARRNGAEAAVAAVDRGDCAATDVAGDEDAADDADDSLTDADAIVKVVAVEAAAEAKVIRSVDRVDSLCCCEGRKTTTTMTTTTANKGRPKRSNWTIRDDD